MQRNHIASTLNAITLAGLFTVVSFSAAGCIAVGGSNRYQAPTLGRQLQDLKVARDTGAVTDAEYQDAKKRLIESDCTRRG